jgi:TPP-dependent 2-oxoacid decarboxylase
MLMSMGEIETIIREDLPMVVVVMNDAAYGREIVPGSNRECERLQKVFS